MHKGLDNFVGEVVEFFILLDAGAYKCLHNKFPTHKIKRIIHEEKNIIAIVN